MMGSVKSKKQQGLNYLIKKANIFFKALTTESKILINRKRLRLNHTQKKY